MALTDIKPVIDQGKAGGPFGALGSIIGAVVGGAAGSIVAPGAGTLSGASLGSALGGAAGTVAQAQSGEEGSVSSAIPVQESRKMPLQSMANHPDVQLAGIYDAKSALKDYGGMPAQQKDYYSGLLDQAAMKLKNYGR